MSLLFKETFNQYSVGHNLIGSGNMDWTIRYDQSGTVTFDVDSNYYSYLRRLSGFSWGAISCNHPNMGLSFQNGKIVIHPKSWPSGRVGILFRYNSLGGYWLQWLPSFQLRLMRFNSWNITTGAFVIQNWDGQAPAIIYEVEIELNGSLKSIYVNNILVGTDTDATHSTGLIGMANYSSGQYVDDIYVYDNNSMSPVAPINLTLTILDSNSIKLNFDNLAFNADYICIERKNGSAGIFLEIDRAPGNAQSYIDRNCQPGNNYYYQVRAVRL